jgi:5-methylcytosine-specific restriction endonuclease McrA
MPFQKGHPNYLIHHTEETKRKISKIRKGKKHSEKTKKKMSDTKKRQHIIPVNSFKKNHIPWIKGKKHTEKSNLKNSEAHKGKIPWNKGKPHLAVRGEKHPKWKGGITPINKGIRQTLEYKEWAKNVYKKDYWSCKICGKKCEKKDIVAHHIKSFNDFPELRFIIDNGITLCRSCHRKIHYN